MIHESRSEWATHEWFHWDLLAVLFDTDALSFERETFYSDNASIYVV